MKWGKRNLGAGFSVGQGISRVFAWPCFFFTKNASWYCLVGLQKSFCKCLLLFYQRYLHLILFPLFLVLFSNYFRHLSVMISALLICFLFSVPPLKLHSVGHIWWAAGRGKCCCPVAEPPPCLHSLFTFQASKMWDPELQERVFVWTQDGSLMINI